MKTIFSSEVMPFMALVMVALVGVAGSPAYGVEIHSFLLSGCKVETGLVVNLDEGAITLIELEGTPKKVTASDVHAVFVSSVLDNPLRAVNATGDQGTDDLTKTLRKVTVGSETFLGWPVRFVESLVIFFDLSGKTRVYERESINKIRPVTESWKSSIAGRPPIGIDLRDLSTECPAIGIKSGLRPNRIMVDQIKVDQYLSDLQKGYAELSAYQERTYLYARSLLFDQKTRLNIMSPGSFFEKGEGFLPVGIQWSSGRPFHFQSFTRFGGQFAEYSPYVQPFFGIRSDLKAHLFHLHFTGDARGLSGGSSVFAESFNYDPVLSLSSEGQIGMNYLLLMGADYGPLSVSAGFFYPSHFLRVGNTYREIKANQRSLAYRVMWTISKMKWYSLFSNFDFSSSAASADDYETNGPRLDSFSLNGQLLRAGWVWDIDKLSRLSLDGAFNRALYSARGGSVNESYDLSRWVVSATARRDFGDYIGLSLTATWAFVDRNFSSFPVSFGTALTGRREQSNPFTVGGQLEIIL